MGHVNLWHLFIESSLLQTWRGLLGFPECLGISLCFEPYSWFWWLQLCSGLLASIPLWYLSIFSWGQSVQPLGLLLPTSPGHPCTFPLRARELDNHSKHRPTSFCPLVLFGLMLWFLVSVPCLGWGEIPWMTSSHHLIGRFVYIIFLASPVALYLNPCSHPSLTVAMYSPWVNLLWRTQRWIRHGLCLKWETDGSKC